MATNKPYAIRKARFSCVLNQRVSDYSSWRYKLYRRSNWHCWNLWLKGKLSCCSDDSRPSSRVRCSSSMGWIYQGYLLWCQKRDMYQTGCHTWSRLEPSHYSKDCWKIPQWAAWCHSSLLSLAPVQVYGWSLQTNGFCPRCADFKGLNRKLIGRYPLSIDWSFSQA